jgi:hypothetical protein
VDTAGVAKKSDFISQENLKVNRDSVDGMERSPIDDEAGASKPVVGFE